jgi:archaellum biogenesis ATPase FlaH
MTQTANDNMTHQNLKTLLSKIEKYCKDALVVVDSYTAIVAGCDTTQPELDLMEFLNSLRNLGQCVIGVNRDLMFESTKRFLDDVKEDWLVFAVRANKAGYSRDVHGTLTV